MNIKDIKASLRLEEVVSHYNLTPDKNQRLNCPWHPDKTPSLQLYPKTNTWTCFSSNCTAGSGDQVDFIMKMEGSTKHEALLKAKTLTTGTSQVKTTQKKEEAPNFPKLFKVFKSNVGKSKKAQAYIKERHLPENIEIGFNGTAWKNLQNCLVFPLKDKEGNVVSFYGRSLTKGHYYTANRKGLYSSFSTETTTLILTESVIDAATLIPFTDYGVLALYGTNGLTAEHTEAIKSLNQLDEIILFFDGDEAGRKAASKYQEELKGLCKVSIVETPEDEDINSLLEAHDPEIFTHLLESRSRVKTETTLPLQPTIKRNGLNTTNPEYLAYQTEGLLFTILGGINIQYLDNMRVTIKIALDPQLRPQDCFRHALDLYNDDQVTKLSRKAAERLEISSTLVSNALSELIAKLEDYRAQRKEAQRENKPQKRILNPTQRAKAINYLQSPNLLKRTNQDIEKTGLIGEKVNRLLMYLVFTSRVREKPLHIISLGASGTGKTYLQEKIGDLIPEDEKKEITSMSENALYYFGQTELKNKLIMIEDLDGTENSQYSLRELQSKRVLSKSVTIKDNKGNMKTVSFEVEGPISLAGTTTKEKIYEDNANRCLLIYLDNSKQQQGAIMDYQRSCSAGLINHQKEDEYKEFFKDMQSILKPIKIVNPYAHDLKIPIEVFKPLRTNDHYLAFIETVTFYHQYQREHRKHKETNETYITTTLADVEAANALLKDVLLAKSDELNQACRNFFERLKGWLKKEEKQIFYGMDVRKSFRLAPTTCKRYLSELQRVGYVKVTGGDKYKKGYQFEVVEKTDYQDLENSINNALEAILHQIRNKKK